MTIFEELQVRMFLCDLITLGLWEQAILVSADIVDDFDVKFNSKRKIHLSWTGPRGQEREIHHEYLIETWTKDDYKTYGIM